LFTVCIILENAFPLRRNSKSKIKRLFQNLVMAATSAVVARFTSVIIVLSAARTSSENKLGLLPVLSSDAWPFAFRICIEVIILDYLIYLWHRLNHVVPFPLAVSSTSSLGSRDGCVNCLAFSLF
jgi:sterol desaturase/sphingolipid hydroxylase (fatty acid hydroxylase superfamily)